MRSEWDNEVNLSYQLETPVIQTQLDSASFIRPVLKPQNPTNATPIKDVINAKELSVLANPLRINIIMYCNNLLMEFYAI